VSLLEIGHIFSILWPVPPTFDAELGESFVDLELNTERKTCFSFFVGLRCTNQHKFCTVSDHVFGECIMAKTTYKVWLVNQVNLGTTVSDPKDSNYYFVWDQAKLTATISELKSLFDDVCKHPLSKFADCNVDSQGLAMVPSQIKPGELLIRLTSKKDSILVKKYGTSAVSNDASGATKDTGNGTVSEAWIEGAAGSGNVSELVARLAFHELMHKKIDAGNSKDIHSKPDDGTGLAVSPVAYNTALSSTNKANMAPRLAAVVSQFTGSSIP
jgi:hypothetical protein